MSNTKLWMSPKVYLFRGRGPLIWVHMPVHFVIMGCPWYMYIFFHLHTFEVIYSPWKKNKCHFAIGMTLLFSKPKLFWCIITMCSCNCFISRHVAKMKAFPGIRKQSSLCFMSSPDTVAINDFAWESCETCGFHAVLLWDFFS